MKIFITITTLLCAAIALHGEDIPKKTGATSIKGDSFRLEMKENYNHFYFVGNVTVKGTNLVATCSEMEVITSRATTEKEKIGPLGNVIKIIAQDNVEIRQTTRTAFADRAEITMLTGIILLEGNAKVTDKDGTLEADRLTLDRHKRNAQATPKEGEQVEVLLPVIPSIDFKDDKATESTPSTTTETQDQNLPSE